MEAAMLAHRLGAEKLLDEWLEGRITLEGFGERLREIAERRGVRVEVLL